MLYPEEWVVPDTRGAADRIWQLRDENARSAAARCARKEVSLRFDPRASEEALVRAVLGD